LKYIHFCSSYWRPCNGAAELVRLLRHRNLLPTPNKRNPLVKGPRRPNRSQLKSTRSATRIPSLQLQPNLTHACRNPSSVRRKKNWLRQKLLTILYWLKEPPTHRTLRAGNTAKIGKVRSSVLSFPTAAATGYFLPVTTSARIYSSPGIFSFALTTV